MHSFSTWVYLLAFISPIIVNASPIAHPEDDLIANSNIGEDLDKYFTDQSPSESTDGINSDGSQTRVVSDASYAEANPETQIIDQSSDAPSTPQNNQVTGNLAFLPTEENTNIEVASTKNIAGSFTSDESETKRNCVFESSARRQFECQAGSHNIDIDDIEGCTFLSNPLLDIFFYQLVAQKIFPRLPDLGQLVPKLRNLPKYRRKTKTPSTRPVTPAQAENKAKARAKRIADSREKLKKLTDEALNGLSPEERERYYKKKAQEAAGTSEEPVIEVSTKDAFAGQSDDWMHAQTESALLDMGCPSNNPKGLALLAGLAVTAFEEGGWVLLIFV